MANHYEVSLEAYVPPTQRRRSRSDDDQRFQLPELLLIPDTETATGETCSMPGFEGPEWKGIFQSLLFGRLIVAKRSGDTYIPHLEYIFYPDNLPERGIKRLMEGLGAKRWGDHYRPDEPPFTELYAMPLSEFMKIFYHLACRSSSYVVGFNLPFDLSRLAIKVTRSKSAFYYNGFSLTLWDSPFRPKIFIASIGNKRAFIGYSKHIGKRREEDVKPRFVRYQNHFIDLHTLILSLTAESHSLDSAARKFLPESLQKGHPETHGIITPEYLAYNRQDVLVTLSLANYFLKELAKHPANAYPEKLFSPASLAKAYIRDMGIKPRLELQPDFPNEIMGFAMSAYYGGRVDTMIRKTQLPIVHNDFMSMYPTVNALLDTWSLIIAQRVDPVEATEEVKQLLESITAEQCFDPKTWPKLRGMALIQPDGDLLPVRAKYGDSYQIGLNPYHSTEPQWYMLPDLVASIILTGKIPRILKAYIFKPEGVQKGLKPVKLRGQVEIDPYSDDFFKRCIEERYQVKKGIGGYQSMPEDERKTLQNFLKNLANSGGYGIYAERHTSHSSKPREITVYSNQTFKSKVTAWDEPGEYFFAPLAALDTSGARLILALLEHEVTKRGGCFVACDTDSMMIVADQTRHEITIEASGQDGERMHQTITALSWDEVREIRKMFERLNPYNRAKVPGSILKIEDDNYDSE